MISRGDSARTTFTPRLVAIAATTAMIVFGSACGAAEDDAATSAAATPATGAPQDPAAEAEALEVVEAAYRAFNSGDVEAWAIARIQASESPFAEALVAADAQIDVSQCDSSGFGAWDMEGTVNGYLIVCEVTETNSFYETGGLDPSVRYEWVVHNGQVLAAASDERGFDDWLRFNAGFLNWMRATHPDVYSGMKWLPGSDFPAAESMPTALEYVNAFVEESPDWPLPAS